MARYKYAAMDINAGRLRGVIEAGDANDAVRRLSERKLFALDVREIPEKKRNFKLKSKQLAEFSKQLSMMLQSGLPMVKALSILVNSETSDARLQSVFSDLHRSLKGGTSLSDAMRASGAFPELIINMFYSGEMSGTIGQVSDKMANFYMADHKMRKKISQATIYPKILALLTVCALIIIFAFVLPTILEMLEGQTLPPITQFMKSISDVLVNQPLSVLTAIAVIVLIFIYLKSVSAVRYVAHKVFVKVPKIGPLLKIIYTARFSRTLSSLYGSGIQLISAIGVSSKIIGNQYIERQFPALVKRVKQGEALSAAIRDVDGFNDKLQNVMLIGEETGRLDEILAFAADSFEYDADSAISSLLAIIEPVMLIVMAVVIGTVIVSALLPIYQMYDVAGGLA